MRQCKKRMLFYNGHVTLRDKIQYNIFGPVPSFRHGIKEFPPSSSLLLFNSSVCMENTQATRSAQRRRSSRHWNVKRRIKVAAPGYGLRKRRGGQKLISKPPCYAVLKYMAPLLLSLATLMYQGKSDHSPFEENPAPAWCLLIATCAYGLMIEAKNQMPTAADSKWSQLFSRTALAAGVLSAVSLISIFLPRRISFVPLIVWTALQPVVLAWPVLHQYAYNWLQTGKFTSVVQKIRAKAVRTRGGNLTGEASSPV